MSAEYLRLIPTDPTYQPPLARDQQASDLLASYFPGSAEITIERYETIQFIDAGSNWGPVSCPACGAALAEETWSSLVDQAYETQFTNLAVRMPCCAARSSLNDLHYEWPVGFARFVLTVRDPVTQISHKQLHQLESLLGCHLRKIVAHY